LDSEIANVSSDGGIIQVWHFKSVTYERPGLDEACSCARTCTVQRLFCWAFHPRLYAGSEQDPKNSLRTCLNPHLPISTRLMLKLLKKSLHNPHLPISTS